MTKCPSCLRRNREGTTRCIHCGEPMPNRGWWGRLRGALGGLRSLLTRRISR